MAGALSGSIGGLVAARVVQGAGAGLVSPAALAGAISGFPPQGRGRALGLWRASAGVANLVGPLLGGLLTLALGWRADFGRSFCSLSLPPWRSSPESLRSRPARSSRLRNQPSGPWSWPRRSSPRSLTFAVMIGSFCIGQQCLQRVAGYSAVLPSSVLVLVALLVAAAAPLAGRLVDRRGEGLPAAAGFLATGTGLLVLGLPSVSLQGAITLVPLVPVGLGLGMLFVPVSRAALNATPTALHGRTSPLLSGGRLLGAGLGGLALTGGASAASVHQSAPRHSEWVVTLLSL